MRGGVFHALQRSPRVHTVIVDDHLHELVQRRALDVGTDQMPATHLAQAPAEKLDGVAAVRRLRLFATDAAAEAVLDPPYRGLLPLRGLPIGVCRLIHGAEATGSARSLERFGLLRLLSGASGTGRRQLAGSDPRPYSRFVRVSCLSRGEPPA
jgi:hypothetical protein